MTITRDQAEATASEDLAKPWHQLLADAHEELEQDRPFEENRLHAAKRLASIQAKASQSADRAACVMTRLTIVIAILTVFNVVFTVVLVIHEFMAAKS